MMLRNAFTTGGGATNADDSEEWPGSSSSRNTHVRIRAHEAYDEKRITYLRRAAGDAGEIPNRAGADTVRATPIRAIQMKDTGVMEKTVAKCARCGNTVPVWIDRDGTVRPIGYPNERSGNETSLEISNDDPGPG